VPGGGLRLTVASWRLLGQYFEGRGVAAGHSMTADGGRDQPDQYRRISGWPVSDWQWVPGIMGSLYSKL
jgi:hypothetical protein